MITKNQHNLKKEIITILSPKKPQPIITILEKPKPKSREFEPSKVPPESQTETIQHQAKNKVQWIDWTMVPLLITLQEILKEIKGLRNDLKR